MSSVLSPPPPAEASVDDDPNAEVLTVKEFLRRGAAGEYGDRKVELIDGRVFFKMSQNLRHMVALQRTWGKLLSALPAAYDLIIQMPAILPASVPEPDVYILRGKLDEYRRRPTEADVPLVVEVSDSTLRFDRGRKRRAYARAGIPIYWIVNAVDEQVEVHTDPDMVAATYPEPTVHRRGESLPFVLDGQEVAAFAVDDLLPPIGLADFADGP